jgi:hypothetical protein
MVPDEAATDTGQITHFVAPAILNRQGTGNSERMPL